MGVALFQPPAIARTSEMLEEPAPGPEFREPRFRDDTLIIQFDPQELPLARELVEAMTRGRVVWEARTMPGMALLQLPPGFAEPYKDLIERVPGVRYAAFDWIGEFAGPVPNDPLFPQQWYLQSTPTQKAINLPCAWTVRTEVDPAFPIAVLDHALEYTSPELAGNMWMNSAEIASCARPGIDDGCNGYCDDIYGIGTMFPIGCDEAPPKICVGAGLCPPPPTGCSGTITTTTLDPFGTCYHGNMTAMVIAAVTNNAGPNFTGGGAGVAWSAKMISVRMDFPSVAAAIIGIDYVRVVGGRLVNMSWSIPQLPLVPTDPLRDIMLASQNEILFVAAAANDNRNLEQCIWNPNIGVWECIDLVPQEYNLPNLIVVAGSTQNDSRWTPQSPDVLGSNYGPTTVHLAAPCLDIRIGYPSGCTPNGTGGTEPCQVYGATSSAAPQVTAVAGLVWSMPQNRTWTPAQVKQRLLSTVRVPLNQSGVPLWDGLTVTEGILDAGAAIGAACLAGEP